MNQSNKKCEGFPYEFQVCSSNIEFNGQVSERLGRSPNKLWKRHHFSFSSST